MTTFARVRAALRRLDDWWLDRTTDLIPFAQISATPPAEPQGAPVPPAGAPTPSTP